MIMDLKSISKLFGIEAKPIPDRALVLNKENVEDFAKWYESKFLYSENNNIIDAINQVKKSNNKYLNLSKSQKEILNSILDKVQSLIIDECNVNVYKCFAAFIVFLSNKYEGKKASLYKKEIIEYYQKFDKEILEKLDKIDPSKFESIEDGVKAISELLG